MDEPLEEAKEGAWAGAELLALTGLGFVAACVIFPPTKLFRILSGSLNDPVKDDVPGFLLRCALFLGLFVGATGLLAWERHRRRRAARAKAPLNPAGAVRVSARTTAGECPFCHDGLATDDLEDGVVRCPGCEVAHHAECWREHEGCSTLGCRRDPRQRDALRERTGE